MSLAAWVLAAVLAVPISKHDRNVDPTAKRVQLETIASAITEAVEDEERWVWNKKQLAGLLVVVARYESGLAMHVHSGDCPRKGRPAECDRGLARGLWQMQVSATSSRQSWLDLVGTDPERTRHAAREAARALSRSRYQCLSLERRGKPWREMVFSAYAGRGCVGWFPGRDNRVTALRRLVEL